MIALATILGVALGMVVVGAILIVDFHSTQTDIKPGLAEAYPALGNPAQTLKIVQVSFERKGEKSPDQAFPSQKGQIQQDLTPDALPTRRGEEDYQAMRLAVRLASLLAFSIGAVIVFYTMRFSVASRSREFCLLLCLGEKRSNVALSLLMETLVLGTFGTVVGLLLALPAAAALIGLGVSTTGRVPSTELTAPWGDLLVMAGLSLMIALLAVLGPARALLRMKIVEVLQPRFLSSDIHENSLKVRGFGLLIPPLMISAYLALRPFLLSWLSVVHFFLVESVFLFIMTLACLWGMPPLLRLLVKLFESAIKPILPLEGLLAGKRMRLTSEKVVFTLAGVTLVFSLLTALHDITRALKEEIQIWASEAMTPYIYFQRYDPSPINEAAFQQILKQQNVYFFRFSDKLRGEFPVRLTKSADINPYLAEIGIPPLLPGKVLVSRTLGARFGLQRGDSLVISVNDFSFRFEIIAVTDLAGFYAENGQYVDLKSYFLFSDGNPLFADNLERSLGQFGAMRTKSKKSLTQRNIAAISPFYRKTKDGWNLKVWQKNEIDKDFMIFDFILIVTVILACVGVTNTLLIQVQSREREFSVLRSLGVSKLQTMRLLLVEGSLIGLVAALLSLALGHGIGLVSVNFLDRFTLFDYRFVFSAYSSLVIAGLAIASCTLAALYPARVAFKVSSAESLHYE